MKYLITKNSYGDLVGFVSFADGDTLPAQREHFTDFVADVLSATPLNCDSRQEESVNWLYEVCFPDMSVVYVAAFNWSNAMVTALLHRGENTVPLYIREYDLYDVAEEGSSRFTNYQFDNSCEGFLPLVAALRKENQDLVAHCLIYADGVSIDTMKHYETGHIEAVHHLSGKLATDLTAGQIYECAKYIWHSYLFIESTDMHLEDMRLQDRHKEETDPRRALFWTYIFEQWGHYDCHMPYTLYRMVVEGWMDDYLAEFKAEREILL